jgi:hypothetical protein
MSDTQPVVPDAPGRVVVPLLDLPAGVLAVTVPRSGRDGPRVPVDRRRRVLAHTVDLIADPQPEDAFQKPSELADADLRWVLARPARRWGSIQDRFGLAALETALRLVRVGGIVLRCATRDGLSLGQPAGWRLTAAWVRHAEMLRDGARERTATWRARAATAADAVHLIDPGLTLALHAARGSEPRLPTVVYAAEDLASGVSHDGPRAFSQAHFEHTKVRDDVTTILIDAGISEASLLALGLRRSPYIGLGGPIRLFTTAGQVIDLATLDGPVQLRVRQRATLEASTSARMLLVVENLQAAEASCDAFPELAVVWTAGQPSDAALELIAALAAQVQHVFVTPDADLGGVRIAQRVLAALPSLAKVEVIDVGSQQHAAREPFSPESQARLRAAAEHSGAAGALAAACLTRGYPVEQEATTRAAIDAAVIACQPG